jgi:hypothetical protein
MASEPQRSWTHGLLIPEVREGQRSTWRFRFQTGGWGRMTSEPPTQLTSSTLTACAQVDTCLPGAACISLLHTLPLPGLRIKTCLLHSFGIIINYYSQGLKPLSLAPLSNLSTPFPLPTLWKLSPPSLFLRGRSARNDVYILLMICIFTYTKSGSLALASGSPA